MKLSEVKMKKIIADYNLLNRENVLEFIQDNPLDLTAVELSRISELVNNSRVDTAAYYTDVETLNTLKLYLPDIDKKVIRILEPSVGVGNFIESIIEKYKNAEKIIIDLNDLDKTSLEITQALNKYRNIPENVEFNYYNKDFLSPLFFEEYDLIVGNPPFLKINKKSGESYIKTFNDSETKNISGFFLQKATKLADYVVLIMPKYFLNNPDFGHTRDKISKYAIDKIIDFGEKGFKGVLVETIAIYINTLEKATSTYSYSVTKDISNTQPQSRLIDPKYPYWLLYRNDFFDNIANKMIFDVFTVFRDRQMTKKILQNSGEIRVIKSRNIKRDGTGILDLDNYDSYIDYEAAKKIAVYKYLNRDDVFLSPNMTYYPRVIRKPKGVLVNGSVAVLEAKEGNKIKDRDLIFLSSKTFEEFYSIARNYSTRSLNIDSNSVKFFGLYER